MNTPLAAPSEALPPPQRPTARQVILGLFVVGQLAFLVTANGVAFIQESRSHLRPAVNAEIERVIPGHVGNSGHTAMFLDEAGTAVKHWADVTGQDQRWALFAPGVWKVTGFPALLLVWEDAATFAPKLAPTLARLDAPDGMEALPPLVVLFPSDNEPGDVRHFARFGRFRVRRYEMQLILYLTPRDDESDTQTRERWDRAIRDHVSPYADLLLAYLKWRLSEYQHRHPDRPPPEQVILVERTWTMLPPEDPSGACWKGPRTLPLARWQPDAEWPAEYRPLERYNPVTERFENVPK
jgi:hypothetical protein